MKKSLSLFILFAFLFLLMAVYKKLVLDYKQEITYVDEAIVLIPKNASAKSIGLLLKQEGVIPEATLFYWSVRLRKLGPKLRSGEYAFPKTRSLKTILEKLIEGDVLYHRLTIAEGLNSRQVRQILEGDAKLAGDLPEAIAEGSLLPETYTFSRGDNRAVLLKTMQTALQKSLGELWEKRSPDLPFKTKEEAVVLASIVEKETALAAERPHIAAVFINRLRKGMLLQTDPTVLYALELKHGKELGRALLTRDLTVDSPYNTYRYPGLPPTPICHGGLASLKAVLNPIESKDLFFVADGTGGHVFSKTYKEHAKNHEKWRKIRSALQKTSKK